MQFVRKIPFWNIGDSGLRISVSSVVPAAEVSELLDVNCDPSPSVSVSSVLSPFVCSLLLFSSLKCFFLHQRD